MTNLYVVREISSFSMSRVAGEKMDNKYIEAKNYIESKIAGGKYDTAVVLGSGYNGIINNIDDEIIIKYQDIPHFPQSSVQGHSGEMIFTQIHNKNVIFLAGRVHFYEGHSMRDITFYIRVLKLLGVENLILTNAAGGINGNFKAGDLAVITDHIKLGLESPLFGANDDEFGVRFPDMSAAYDKEFIKIAEKAFLANSGEFLTGVYAYMGGPQFETPAEIKALAILGADMVGMSTVPEVIVANHCGMRVLAISLISNLAAGIAKNPLTHEEVMEEGKKAADRFFGILKEIINNMQ